MNDIQQRIAGMNTEDRGEVLLELVTALHDHNTGRAYEVLRDAALGQNLTPAEVDDEVEMKFCNFYRCPRCGCEWQDEWDCTCNDECPECGIKDIEPYKSEDL